MLHGTDVNKKTIICLYSCDFVLHPVDEILTDLLNHIKCSQRNATTKGNSSFGCKEGSESECWILLPGTASVALVAQTYLCGR